MVAYQASDLLTKKLRKNAGFFMHRTSSGNAQNLMQTRLEADGQTKLDALSEMGRWSHRSQAWNSHGAGRPAERQRELSRLASSFPDDDDGEGPPPTLRTAG